MNSKISFFNKSVFKTDFKRFWWVSVLYFLTIFMTIPFILLALMAEPLSIDLFSAPAQVMNIVKNFLSIPTIMTTLFLAPLVAVTLFSYLQKSKTVSFFHSLPLKKSCLYISHIVSGLIIILIPLVINAMITKVIFRLNGIVSDSFTTLLIQTALIAFTTFSIAVFVSTFTGSTVASYIFTYVFSVFPAAITFIVEIFCYLHFYGYTSTGKSLDIIKFIYNPENFYFQIIVGVICLVAGLFIYKKRALENYGTAVAFKKLRPVFVQCVGLAFGLISYFAVAIMYATPNIFTLIPFGLIGITAAIMIANKTFRVPKFHLHLIPFVIIIGILAAIFQFDVFGYQSKIPNPENVEYVYVVADGIPISGSLEDDDNQLFFSNLEFLANKPVKLTDTLDVETITKLHQRLVDNKELNDRGYQTCIIEYHLKDGSVITRSYTYDMNMYPEMKYYKALTD